MKSEPKHTPGPWEYVQYDDGDCAVIGPEGDERICELITNEPPEARDANGELIARAPELLAENERLREALRDALIQIEEWQRGNNPENVEANNTATIHRLRAALEGADW